MEVIRINSLTEIKATAEQFIQLIGENRVFAFYGSMGAGKTTFIKSICSELGVIENITSPTFSIVNEYITANNRPIYHFDCYRLKNIGEAYDFGADEYFFSDNLCFIEWPEKIEELLPPDCVKVTIGVLDDESREVTISI
jgi:tRNA threonylcarbamoyladenosine biosynthesis protein TsaE